MAMPMDCRHGHGQRENVAPAGDQRQDATVIRVGEALPTVLLRNFHSECTKIEQPLNHRFGNFRLTFDGFSIDVVPQNISICWQYASPAAFSSGG